MKIETDETTCNRTVIGEMAHNEYFKRLKAEREAIAVPSGFISDNAFSQ